MTERMEMTLQPLVCSDAAFSMQGMDERSLGIEFAHHIELTHQIVGFEHMHVEPFETTLQRAECEHRCFRFTLGQRKATQLGREGRAETDFTQTLPDFGN